MISNSKLISVEKLLNILSKSPKNVFILLSLCWTPVPRDKAKGCLRGVGASNLVRAANTKLCGNRMAGLAHLVPSQEFLT